MHPSVRQHYLLSGEMAYWQSYGDQNCSGVYGVSPGLILMREVACHDTRSLPTDCQFLLQALQCRLAEQ